MKYLNHLRNGMLIGMLSFTARASAQESSVPDTIFFHDGRTLVVQIDEIGLEAIIYHSADTGPRMAVDKAEVDHVKLHTGGNLKLAHDGKDTPLPSHTSRKKHVVKVDLLSPATNHLVFGYEQVVRPWMNVEAKVGVIGVGIAKQDDYRYTGFMLKAGIKFIARPAVVMRGMHLNSLVSGGYIKPELIFVSYRTAKEWLNLGSSPEPDIVKQGDFAFNLVFGDQLLLGNTVTVDAFLGIGLGTHWVRTDELVEKDQAENNPFGVLTGGSSLPIAVSGGLTVGVAF